MTPKKVQSALCEMLPGLKFKNMPKWLTKLWWADGFIWLNTIYIRPGLEDEGVIRLSAHDAVHVDDKRFTGRLKAKFLYMFSESWRLYFEARGYGLAFWIAEQQGFDRKLMLDAYVDVLATKYKITIPRRIIEMELRSAASVAAMRLPGTLTGDFAIWWDENT